MDGPIFVRGLSRSGGTLLVTILDCHSRVAMSYELYPTLIDFPPYDYDRILGLLESEKAESWILKNLGCSKFRTLVARASRSGMTPKDVGYALKKVGPILTDSPDEVMVWKMSFIEECGKFKLTQTAKQIWGMKCNNSFEMYRSCWNNGRFINIIRDGRDVLASQKNTGSFNADPITLARSWANTNFKFRAFSKAHPANCLEIRYEDLVSDLASTILTICEFLSISFESAMLEHQTQNLTLFHSNHLSLRQVSSPVSVSKIGRWKSDLTMEEVAEFESVGRDALENFGYEV